MVRYSIVSAFTDTPGMGNAAGVVLEAQDLRAPEMQAVAAQLGLSETVFVTRRDLDVVRVRYFTPTQEIEFCGHATVAVGLCLACQGWFPDHGLRLETLAGDVPLSLEEKDGVPKRVWMIQPELRTREISPDQRERLAEALGISERMLHRTLPLASAYTGLWTAFVPLIDPTVVDALEPDYAEITRLSQELEVSGLHPYAPMGPSVMYTRDFAPLVGIDEDPVTGSASGALIGLLAERGLLRRNGNRVNATCLQGHAIGQPGEVAVEVRLEPGRRPQVRVGGCAAVESEGRL
ncbi:PhzF family phenazine biosynthesis protein [Deinobacterium chartae]|uniref:PhzF family phenazine biosynthesis protein n=1 Tax=Deinobacterium chartae TaxID=521158 RepID=A0A841HXR3_9DEIO|nr:PhzF family phenazine biosynthesis protein [Deinobacterium chartae]MBB6096708.1 PhzF family phenazine biosynthesis protein [Deinobacterium chartae]